MTGELIFDSAAEQARRIRSGDVSPVELVDAYLARIETVDTAINAYTTVCAERARDAARIAERTAVRGGPLGAVHGVPFAVKDLLFTAGVRTTGGSRVYADSVVSVRSPTPAR